LLEVSSSGYYDWLKRSPSLRDLNYKELDRKIAEIIIGGRGNYGVEKVRKELAKQGDMHGDKLVRKRMRAQGVEFVQKRKFIRTTDSNHNQPCAANLLDRDFRAPLPGAVYVGDITYIPGSNGWIYLATVIDLFSRKVAGWAIAEKMDVALVNKALIMACQDHDLSSSFIFHSDRGSQYASREYRALLASLGGVQSMSRKGDCWDNAVAESFNGILKCEWLYRRSGPLGNLKTIELEVFDYIECFYNRKRSHSTLNYVSPAEFEAEYFTKNMAA
jgi:transposase InsO family protein